MSEANVDSVVQFKIEVVGAQIFRECLTKKSIEEINRKAVRDESWRADEVEASKEEIPLLKKRKSGAQDRLRTKLQDLAGSGSSTRAAVPSNPKKMVIEIEYDVLCNPLLLKRTLSIMPIGAVVLDAPLPDANVLALTKKLDDANTVPRISAEALGVANEEKLKLKKKHYS
ncbi:hypothetical protein Adt_23214 [Abeliophyllum distichum]|uniref:Uncharacterized protein n=1 Tax=Abeliophyllum distichum TaxID=126358 RepID=A0ABD1SDN9_9LAMI